MFEQLTQELLDLTVTEKGYRNALYAAKWDCCACCSCCRCLFSCR